METKKLIASARALARGMNNYTDKDILTKICHLIDDIEFGEKAVEELRGIVGEATPLIGVRFREQGRLEMEVVSRHEKFPGEWWCEGTVEPTGLWLYSEEFILENRV